MTDSLKPEAALSRASSAVSNSPVFVAIDTGDLTHALQLAQQLQGQVGGLKLGLEFFLACGHDGYRKIAGIKAEKKSDKGEAAKHLPIFLDLKLHDIPNTVGKAVLSLLPLRPNYITIHTSGGAAMMRAAADAAAKAGYLRPKLLGVTVLTSLDQTDLVSVGQASDSAAQTLRLAKLAKDSGLDGVVCAGTEVAMLRAALGTDFVLMVPGIRPAWADTNDQKRNLSPKEAMAAGATHLVIGRPITESDDPLAAMRRIAEELV